MAMQDAFRNGARAYWGQAVTPQEYRNKLELYGMQPLQWGTDYGIMQPLESSLDLQTRWNGFTNSIQNSFERIEESSTKVDIESVTATVEEIHHSVDNIEEFIMKEVQTILNDASEEEIDEYRKLAELGFMSTPKREKIRQTDDMKKEVENNASLMAYYYDKYHKKFLSYGMITLLCKKYKLIFGEAKRFIGNIPSSSRKEILAFEGVKEKDRVNGRVSYQIAAPAEMFNTKGCVINDKQELVYDPIALYPVMEGYLVISKWGAEENLDELK